VELGHDVTLFASADASTKAKLISVRDQAIRLDPYPFKSDVIAPTGKIIYEYTALDPAQHVGNTMAAVEKWKAEHKGA
jgi:hypothetical protein